MFSRSLISTGLALLLALVFVLPALAGGWAVITLDELPANVVAGTPLTIGFTVRQHGRTPMNGLDATVTATLLTDKRFAVNAELDDKPGHYTATLTFPKEGEWSWSIQAFTMDQRMPILHVAAPGVAATNQSVQKTEPAIAFSPVWIVRLLALGAGCTGLVLVYKRKNRLALSLTGFAVIMGVASFLMGIAVPKVEAQTQDGLSSTQSEDSATSQVEIGRQLFIAKGCITCHYNDRVASRSDHWTIEIGAPDLTRYSSHPDVLFIRLKDPAAAKSDTKMPDLELKETEIQALIAFINSK